MVLTVGIGILSKSSSSIMTNLPGSYSYPRTISSSETGLLHTGHIFSYFMGDLHSL